MSTAVSGLTDHLGYLLRLVSNQVSYAFAGRLAAKNVTVAEWTVVRVLYDEEPVSPSALAKTMGLTRGAITKLADRLIAKGFVARKSDQKDRRAQTLRLTAKGERIVPELAAMAVENDAQWFGGLSGGERDALKRLLRDMVARFAMTSAPID
jgi:MarR family transcriptional regulator, lower aerobic nicotinate degradation pathway regulator